MQVKLANAGSIVRRPRDDSNPGKPLEFGKVEEVADSTYWRRRLKAGEIVMADATSQDVFRENGREEIPEVKRSTKNHAKE